MAQKSSCQNFSSPAQVSFPRICIMHRIWNLKMHLNFKISSAADLKSAIKFRFVMAWISCCQNFHTPAQESVTQECVLSIWRNLKTFPNFWIIPPLSKINNNHGSNIILFEFQPFSSYILLKNLIFVPGEIEKSSLTPKLV